MKSFIVLTVTALTLTTATSHAFFGWFQPRLKNCTGIKAGRGYFPQQAIGQPVQFQTKGAANVYINGQLKERLYIVTGDVLVSGESRAESQAAADRELEDYIAGRSRSPIVEDQLEEIATGIVCR